MQANFENQVGQKAEEEKKEKVKAMEDLSKMTQASNELSILKEIAD